MVRQPRFSSPGVAAKGMRRLRPLSVLLFAWTLSGCHLFENRLERIRSSGELVVLTRTAPTTYYETPEGPAGFEYDLAEAFAEYLGVRLKIVTVARAADVLPRLLDSGADLAAAGLTAAEGEGLPVRFTPPYQTVRQQVVYRLGNDWPRGIEALIGREIEVPADSRHGRRLAALKRDHPALVWREDPARTSEDLLQTVWEGLLDITVADSHVISVNRQFFPELQLAFSIQEPEGLAWALADEDDDSLLQAATEFLAGFRKNGELAQLLDRYYGPSAHANFINLTVYQLRIQNRLPQYQKSFATSAKRHGLDWRLLAAMGYQESYWDPHATSPTGVRGMMMLTQETAERVGVRDRLDPEQSIEGGARYLREMLDRIPETVTAPDRLWMALAAYNVGLYHLEDARVITQMQGGDPNRWNDVKERLPLLESRQWASRAKYGYARGREPVIFVNRVRTYHDVLVRIDDEERARRRTKATKIKIPAI
jgi:membrane-bound lytic murein transglycosylase F